MRSPADRSGDEAMKTRKRKFMSTDGSAKTRDREVQREITKFYYALSSYPRQFEKHPSVSFQEHMISIACDMESEDSNRRRAS